MKHENTFRFASDGASAEVANAWMLSMSTPIKDVDGHKLIDAITACAVLTDTAHALMDFMKVLDKHGLGSSARTAWADKFQVKALVITIVPHEYYSDDGASVTTIGTRELRAEVADPEALAANPDKRAFDDILSQLRFISENNDPWVLKRDLAWFLMSKWGYDRPKIEVHVPITMLNETVSPMQLASSVEFIKL